jgi:glycosyltransferase involved in cell wall biosynthesis
MADEGFEVFRFSGNGRNPAAFWQIRTRLRRVRPDVLHYNDSHAVTAAGLASVGLGIGARVAARHLCFPIRWPFRYRAFCDRLVCVSHAAAQACRESGIPPRMIRVVYGGIDIGPRQQGDLARGRAALGLLEACHYLTAAGKESSDTGNRIPAAVKQCHTPSALGTPDGPPALLTVAQLVPCKGHVYLFEAMKSVVQQRPQIQLALAGDGPLRASLETLARDLGIDSHVRFLGHRPDVPDLLAAADLFVLPSLSEALPVTLMEAMLAGCPIVATTAGGIGDLVGNQHSGETPVAWTVPPGDPQALAAAILDGLDDHALRTDRIKRARCRLMERFTADRMVEATLAVYDEILPTRQS